ncbi:MAG: trans-aconitate 2-methyltransferase [Pseudobdellovibrionaceae bacterium]
MTFEWFVNHILRWLCLFVLLWDAYALIFNKGIPNIRTAPAIRKRILSVLKQEAENHVGDQPFTIIDMGSGNGKFTREIASALPDARVIGIEISKPALVWSRLLKRLRSLKNVEYIDQSFFDYYVGHADAVVMYLTIYQMETIGKKLHEELKSGALVTSNRFQLGDGWVPLESVRVRTFYPHQRTFHIYRQK